MRIGKRHKVLLIVAMVSVLEAYLSASSRPWRPTPSEIAADYASINHNRGNGDFVTIAWWAPPTATPSASLLAILEKYVLISVIHSHVNIAGPDTGISLDDIKTLEARDQSGNALNPVLENELSPALNDFEAGYRRGLGPRGKGARFFLFDAGTVRACEKGGISVAFDGEIYTWETPFPGCFSEADRKEGR